MTDMEECRQALLNAFPGSCINKRGEFIADTRSNTYFILSDCNVPIDIECKTLEWFTRPAHKGMPYNQEWRNQKFREFMMNGINGFLDTNFNQDSMEHIYCALGNAIDHEKTIKFIKSGYNLDFLN